MLARILNEMNKSIAESTYLLFIPKKYPRCRNFAIKDKE